MQNPFKIFSKHAPAPAGGNVPSAEPEAGVQLPVDEKRISEWNAILRSYKSARSTVEQKIKSNESFWRMRQWKEGLRSTDGRTVPSTAWLFSCIQSKLADVMESYPTVNFRPRQKDDEEEARRLSAIVPVIVAQNDFEQTYRNVSEYTLKNGVGVYHVRWDGSKHGGLGDIVIEEVNVLNIFWEPGITDLQRSAYVFTVELVDPDVIKRKYPDRVKNLRGKTVEPEQFKTDEMPDTHGKSAVVDVYYKVNGVLHYCKYVDNTCLEATENEPEKYPNGLYDHGRYPFEVQQLYHIEQSLYGTGLVDIGADTQIQIDLMNEAIVENTLMGARPRYFSQTEGNVNEEDMLDWRRSVVRCKSLSETNVRQIDSKSLQGNYLEFLNMKTEELKYVTSNHDVSNGAAPSGITAASAIAALQETSGKNSRLINKTFYSTFARVMELVVELIRQFYGTRRWFRIVPDAIRSGEEFISYDNSYLCGVPQPAVNGEDMGPRIPEFDIEITAERANPYKKMEINELALSFYKLGFFNPQMSEQAVACLEMMDFDAKDRLIEKISRNGMLLRQLTRYRELCAALAKKYGDAQALRLIADGDGVEVQPFPSGGGDVTASTASEPKSVENARAAARRSTEVS